MERSDVQVHAQMRPLAIFSGPVSPTVGGVQDSRSGVLQYLAQLSELPKAVDGVETASLASIVCAPMHAISAGAPVRFDAIRTISGVVAWLAALRMDVLDDIRRDLEADADDDEALLARRSARWEGGQRPTVPLQSRAAALRLPPQVLGSGPSWRAGGGGLREWVRGRELGML